MKLHLINELKDSYKEKLGDGSVVPDSLFRLCILQWQKHFDIEEVRLAGVIDSSLKNDESGRYWGGEKHSIKSGLIELAKQNFDLFYEAVKDLLDEERMIIMRANRFIHHCDEIFLDIKRNDLKKNTHYQNYYSASLLLSLHHPAQYCLFDFDVFEAFCKKIGVLDIPVSTDLERYYKISRAVYNVITKDEDFMSLYYEKLNPGVYFGPSLSVVYDFMRFTE